MTPAQEGSLWIRGGNVVLASLLGLGLLAYFVDWRFAYIAVGLVVVWLLICHIHAKREDKRLGEAFQAAFETFDGVRPELRRINSYGYPFFSVCFRTEEEMIRAFESGHLRAFRTALVRLYEFGGFDVEKGFEETYLGWENDLRETSVEAWTAQKLKRRADHYGASDSDEATR